MCTFVVMETTHIEKKKKPKKISKDILNIIRTTMRNNIELTHIADNKANVLLSLNALMITFLVPFVVPNFDLVRQYRLGLPIALLVITCFITIYISALVLKPGKFDQNQKLLKQGNYVSPFYFGNIYKMNRTEYAGFIKEALSDADLVKNHLVDDLHHIGARLGRKMFLIRSAFNIFMIGFFSSISLGLIFIYLNQASNIN